MIAEGGVNHNGDISIAKQLIDCSAEIGADAIKFQSFSAEKLIAKGAEKSNYQKDRTPKKQGLQEMLKALELNREQHFELQEYAKKRKMLFLSTPFDENNVDLLDELDIPLYKISSGDITSLSFIRYIAKKQRPIILSTGRSTLDEIEDALSVIRAQNNQKVAILHCVSQYPAPMESLNLRAIDKMKSMFGVPVGFSDHSLGIEAPIAAVALGAVIIEKHLTIDRQLEGPDHAASLEPAEFSQMTQCIRNIEKALGDGEKKPTEEELSEINKVRRGIYLSKNVKQGEPLDESAMTLKRPMEGIPSKYFDLIIGKKILKDAIKDTALSWDMIESIQ